jgi:hypothetical protein
MTKARECKAAREIRGTLTVPLEVRLAGTEGEIEGYGSVFGVRDSYDDIVAPGAFAASLASHRQAGTLPAMLWQHREDMPIGVWTAMEEDRLGLKVRGTIAAGTTAGKDALEILRLGGLNGLSIGFRSINWSYDEKSGVRTLSEIELWEVSLVTFPANSAARITTVRSAGQIERIETPKDAELILREAGMSKAEARDFVSGVMRLGSKRREDEQACRRISDAATRLRLALQS